MQPFTGQGLFSPWEPGVLPLVLWGGLTLALVALLLFLASWLGERKPGLEKSRPYECGIIPSGPARVTQPLPFYLVAVFFLLFDVETAFILAWAVGFTDLGWLGWGQITFFIVILLAGLLYVWAKGGLDWIWYHEPQAEK